MSDADRDGPGGQGPAKLGRAAGLALAVAVATPSEADDRALLVGIDRYGAGLAPAELAGAVADAQRVRDHLVALEGFEPGQVTLLADDQATSTAILDALTNELLGLTRPGDRAVFYFAGFGATKAGASGATVPALVAYDADSLLGRIPGDMFADLLDLIDGRHVTVVIDASFVGPPGTADGAVRARGLPAVAGTDPSVLTLFGQGRIAREVWNAAAPGQVAWEADGAGLFTRALLDGWADTTREGASADTDLRSWVAARTQGWCDATPACVAAGGDFAPALALGPATAAPIAPPGDPAPAEAAGLAGAVALAGAELGAVNPARLRLSIEGPTPLRLGDAATLRIEADRPGRLLLLDLHAGWGLALLGEATLPDDAPLSLAFRAAEPVGPGALVGVLLEAGDFDAAALLPEGGGSDPGRALKALHEALRRLEQERGVPWSAAVLPYDVSP